MLLATSLACNPPPDAHHSNCVATSCMRVSSALFEGAGVHLRSSLSRLLRHLSPAPEWHAGLPYQQLDTRWQDSGGVSHKATQQTGRYTYLHTTQMGWLEGVLSLDGTLDKKERKKRTLFLCLVLSSAVFPGTAALTYMGTDLSERLVPVLSLLLQCFMSLCLVIYILCKGPLTERLVVCACGVFSVTMLVLDLSARSTSGSSWPMLVLVVDLLLVMQVQERFVSLLVLCTLCYLVIIVAEETLRFGLLDLPGLVPQEGERGRRHLLESKASCASLPCAIKFGESFRAFLLAAAVFVIDFIATRGFARDVLKEQASIERTINAVQEIAALLAGYDVEQVAELLATHEHELPEGMTAALRRLEENLRKYRPYLPAALFEVDEDGVQQPTVAPPGLDSETATIVFTDIRASTSIWENAPEGMRAGLQIHNAVMRDVMRMCGGYEVKTIGDAFMIAFASTFDGVAFGLRVQERLFEADWPASLLEDAPICSRQGSLWGGLTVRIGVNTGPVTVEQNTLTGRTDYFGHTVNVASRLESTCTPGAVAVPSDLWTSVSESCSAVVGVPEGIHLKGVSGSTLVCCVWPVSLGGRRETPLCESSLPTANLTMSLSTFAPSVSHITFVRTRGRMETTPCESSLCESSSQSAKPHTSLSICASSVSSRNNLAVSTRQTTGTLGIAQLAVGDMGKNIAFHQMSSGLTTLTIALEQSGGSLVTLLGNCVCVGWNVSRSAPAHMENAIRFVQRMSVKSALNGAGLSSGPVQHGDVGARSQRFVTVMGDVVRRSWALCEEAVRDGVVCLYEPPEGTTLPCALEDVLMQHKGCYRVLEAQDNRECDSFQDMGGSVTPQNRHLWCVSTKTK